MNNKSVTLKSFIRKNGFIDIVSEHGFNVTLGDFEQIINIGFRHWKLSN